MNKPEVSKRQDILNSILYPVLHQQFVFSIPIILCVFFNYDREFLTELWNNAKDGLAVSHRSEPCLDQGIPGMTMVSRTFGDYGRLHPQLHAIVAQGLVRPNGTFYCLPKPDLTELEDGFGSKMLAMRKTRGT